MNALQMQIEFERLLYTSNPDFSSSDKLDTEEIFAYLNISQLRVMKAKYFPTSDILENVRIIQSNIEELRNLIKRDTRTIGNSIDTLYGYLVSFPTDYLHYIRSDSVVTRTTIFPMTSQVVPNKIIDYSNVDSIVTNTFNNPIIRKPCIVFEEDDNMVIFRDKYTSFDGDLYLTYLRTPIDIALGGSNDCELADYLHEEIVATAVDIFRREKYLLNTKQEVKDDTSRNA